MAGEKVRSLSVPVKGIMSTQVITTFPEDNLRGATKKMFEYDISSLVIVSRDKPVGIVTKRDFLESIAQLEKVERKLTLQFSMKDVEADIVQKSTILDDFESFSRRYEETLGASTLYAYMKAHGTNFTGNQLVHCRLQLRSKRRTYFSSSEGWNVENTFRRALDRLDRQILRSKELEREERFIETYLQRIGFSTTEL
jgi:hypothetical protein